MARKAKLNPALSTLYNAPDVRENRRLRGGIAELPTDRIAVSDRLDDRLLLDIDSLKESIAQLGQRVPILVRPGEGDRYDLIYGRRRLEACRALGLPVRAIVTELEDGQALKDQLVENQARHDLSFIERALVAVALLDGDHLPEAEREQKAVAEILNVTPAAMSQMAGIVRGIGEPLIRAIGAAPGIGRPRWDQLRRAVEKGAPMDTLLQTATAAGKPGDSAAKRSDAAFNAVLAEAKSSGEQPEASPALTIADVGTARVTRKGQGKLLRLELDAQDADFAGWLEAEVPSLLAELHGRWNARRTEPEQSDTGGTTESA